MEWFIAWLPAIVIAFYLAIVLYIGIFAFRKGRGRQRVTAPLLVGGAALSQKFTDTRISPAYGGLAAYAEDAMKGLALTCLLGSSVIH